MARRTKVFFSFHFCQGRSDEITGGGILQQGPHAAPAMIMDISWINLKPEGTLCLPLTAAIRDSVWIPPASSSVSCVFRIMGLQVHMLNVEIVAMLHDFHDIGEEKRQTDRQCRQTLSLFIPRWETARMEDIIDKKLLPSPSLSLS